MGFATIPGKSERDQANWWARAVSTFLADPNIEHIGVYEIKDLPHGKRQHRGREKPFPGAYPSRSYKELAFHTVALLKTLLGSEKITPADDGALTVTVFNGEASELNWRLFKRSDGKQVFFVYDKSGRPTVRVKF